LAERLGSLRRLLLVAGAVVALAAAAYLLFLRSSAVAPDLVSPEPVAVIGSGSEAAAVAGDGTVLTWLPVPEDSNLPQLPLSSVPKEPRVQGPVLEQVRVLAAAPPALRPYLASSSFGETGVAVELSSGIELLFGSASDATRKWRSVAAVLADPSITALDYVNVLAPTHPTVGGSGHALPPIE
jgi:cell division septal protein FtsQ